MCVIIAGYKKKPDLEILEKCEHANAAGAGIAWVNKEGLVRYAKGLDAKGVNKILSGLGESGRPYAVHFRLATVGSESKELCHPFPISAEVEEELNGKADAVLFHNGHFTDWNDMCLKHAVLNNVPPPDGEMSDSRALAWLVHRLGPSVLEYVRGNKFALLSNEGLRMYPHDMTGWVEKDGVFYSNMNWMGYSGKHRSSRYGKDDDKEYEGYMAGGHYCSGTRSYPAYPRANATPQLGPTSPAPAATPATPAKGYELTPSVDTDKLDRELRKAGFLQDEDLVLHYAEPV